MRTTYVAVSGLFSFFTVVFISLMPQDFSHSKIRTRSDSVASVILKIPCNESFECLVDKVSCNMSKAEIGVSKEAKDFLSEQSIIKRTQDCNEYFQMISSPSVHTAKLSDLETPLAFTISLHKHTGILEMFLKVAFRPTDSYCFHLDLKSSEYVKQATQGIVKCYQERYPNATIFIADRSIDVRWGGASILEAEFLCMRRLRDKNKDWQYLMNPAGSELPLMPIDEIRETLRTSAKSLISSYPMPKQNAFRFRKLYLLQRNGPKEFDLSLKASNYVKNPPPFNLTLRKGSKNVVLQRPMVEDILNEPVIWRYYDWIKTGYIPDEHFYSVLATFANSTQWKGLTLKATKNLTKIDQDLSIEFTNDVMPRYSEWTNKGCDGQMIRSICNFAKGDLSRMRENARKNKVFLTANKFNLKVDPDAVICQAQHILDLETKF